MLISCYISHLAHAGSHRMQVLSFPVYRRGPEWSCSRPFYVFPWIALKTASEILQEVQSRISPYPDTAVFSPEYDIYTYP
jgi:hypothetical protein